MDLIYTNAEKEDVGVLLAYEMDLAFGADENNFECTVSRETNPCDAGCYLYINGTEYGGMIDAVKTDTASDDVVYTGRTWHGILNSKVIEPDAGEDYLVLNGEANAVIGTLISRLGLTDLFAADTAASGVTIKSFKMDRYIEGYNGIKKMLSRFGGKLRMAYTNGVVTLSAAPVVDYTEGVDSDFVDFTAKQVQNKVNHLICLGGGDLAARTVKHLYADASGNISQTQTLTGINEYAAVYDYPNAASDEELISYGTDRFKELLNQDELNVTFDDDTDESYDIGDIVGATDNVSGVRISVAITKKIVSIKNGLIAISYDNPDGSSQAVVSSGGGGSSGGNGSFDALDVSGNAAIGSKLSVQGETTLNGALNVQGVATFSGKTLLDLIHPVGSFYFSENITSPETLFGGTWERIKDTFILAAGDTYAAGSTGGEAEHTLTENEMPSHYHSIQNTGVARFTPASSSSYWCWFNAGGYNQAVSYNTGGSGAHNNMPPYMTAYVWKRTA